MKTEIWMVMYRVLLLDCKPSQWYKRWFNTELEAFTYKEAIKDVWDKFKGSEKYLDKEICVIRKQDVDLSEHFKDEELWGTDPAPIRKMFVKFLNNNATDNNI